ncbi:MAG: DUF3267 domain-containing protein [Crenarchaeota archaeon]|nr:DUF3267 domain-containing protein [Thermoproteota archaeon]
MNITQLPEGYQHIKTINLKSNKKYFIIVNVLSFAIMAVLVIIGLIIQPFPISLSNRLANWPQALTIILSIFPFIVIHEMIHGILMYLFSKIKPHFGISWTYAYAGSKAYFKKIPYIIISSAPVTIIGIITLIANFLVSDSWFWVVYFIQILNLSGAAGDIFVTATVLKLPSDILTIDSGTEMLIYSKTIN